VPASSHHPGSDTAITTNHSAPEIRAPYRRCIREMRKRAEKRAELNMEIGLELPEKLARTTTALVVEIRSG